MDDDEIDQLARAVSDGDVYCVVDGRLEKCVLVVREWYEQFPNGEVATTPEPAAFFEDGHCAALWATDAADFVRCEPLFLPPPNDPEQSIQRSRHYITPLQPVKTFIAKGAPHG